jgi:hypothetical protein
VVLKTPRHEMPLMTALNPAQQVQELRRDRIRVVRLGEDAEPIARPSGLISDARGTIVVLDRNGLIKRANGLYGIAESEYERLLGTTK